MPAQVLDYSLTNFKVPGLAQYTPPFGTKKADGSGLTTTEITRNEMMSFLKQRPISGIPPIAGNDPPMGVISVDSIATPIEFDANFAVAEGIQLQLDDPSFEGQVAKVVASFENGNPAIITLGVSGTPAIVNLVGGETLLLFAVNGKWVRFKNGLDVAGGSKTPRERYLFYNTASTIRLAGEVPIRYKNPYTGDYHYFTAPDDDLIIDVVASLDTGVIQAGKDYYTYLVPQQTGSVQIKTSLNATYPAGVASADYAFQIGGFHTICAAVENKNTTLYIHPFSSRAAGEIHLNSVWDLYHRSSATKYQGGFYYSEALKKWVSIYLMSATGTFPSGVGGDTYPPSNGALISGFGLTIADGASTPKFHGDKFAQLLASQGMRLPKFDEFVAIALGSPESVNINGSADPVTTGGHSATNSQRIISFEGAEDVTGVLWQWCQETYGPQTGTYADRFTVDDIQAKGQMYGTFCRLLAGGYWGDGATCGSRASDWDFSVLYLYGYLGCRAVAEPLN
jgi:hypothetical protein